MVHETGVVFGVNFGCCWSVYSDVWIGDVKEFCCVYASLVDFITLVTPEQRLASQQVEGDRSGGS